jgi:putative transposase
MTNRNTKKASGDYYSGYRHPKLLIGYVVWSYHRFTLSLRDLSEQLMMRGIIVSHETIREWSLTFGQTYANEIKRRVRAI